jgi:hypothetical protein
VAFPAQNARLNKLLMESSEDFIDWMDELFVGSKEAAPVRSLTRNDRTELFENLKKDVRIHSEMKNSNKFTGWVKNWAELRGFYMQVDKSGRNYYWTFVKKEK